MNSSSTHRTASASPLANSSPSPVSPISNPNVSPINTKALSNQQIEAVIQMATSSAGAAARDTRTQLFVGNLPYRVRWQDLKDLFRKAGTVLRADVSLGPDNRSRGYGTVLLATSEDAARAVDMFNGYNWQTRTLDVRLDRLPTDFDYPTSLSVPPHQSPIPQTATKTFPVPVPYGSPVGDRAVSYTSSDELDPSKNLADRMRTGSSSSSRTLFVGNLPFHCQWQELKDLFRQAGSILRADVALGPDGRSRGFGTVSFTNDMDAEQAVNMFNGYEYNGRILKVHYDKYSGLPQSPLPSSALAMPSPTQLHHAHSGPPTHIPMPVPPPVSTFEHLAAGHHPPSPYDHPFGQLSPYDIYPTHMATYMTNNATMPSSVCGSWVNPQQGQPSASSLIASQASVSSSPTAMRDGDTIPHHPLGVAATVTETADLSVSSAAPDGVSSLGTASLSTTAMANTTATETQQFQSTQQHHPHPGPISLPSPPLHGFPIGGPISPLQGLPPLTPSMPSFTFVPQNATPPLNAHFLSPGVGITPFSPPMSPGSFYHPPANQRYHVWNVAPGAPLHVPSPMGSPNIYQGYSNPIDPNKMDYFSVPPPPARGAEGYFPPVPIPSGLSKEIKQQEESSSGESPPEESESRGGRDGSAGSVPTASGSSSTESGEGSLGSLATKIGEQVLGNGLEKELAELSIQGGLKQGVPMPLPAATILPHAALQRTRSDGSPKEDGEADVSLRDVRRDAWAGAMPAERRASWTPASELARAAFKEGLPGEGS